MIPFCDICTCCVPSPNANICQRRRQFVGQRRVVRTRAVGGQVARSVLWCQITPALKGTAGLAFGADNPRVEHDTAAPYPVFANHFFQPNDALTGKDKPFENPIQRAASQKLFLALGPHARDVTRVGLTALRHTRSLPGFKVFDLLCSDTEFYQIYGADHEVTPDIVVSLPLYAESRPLAIDLTRPDRLVSRAFQHAQESSA